MTTTQPTDRIAPQQEASPARPSSAVGLDAQVNSDTPVQGGVLPDKPQTLKTFTIDLDDWQLP